MWPVIVNIPLFGKGTLPVPAFGVMLVIAFLSAVAVMRRLVKREGIEPAKIEPLFTILLIGIIVGSRLFHVLTHLDDFRGRWIEVVRIDKGGMVMYGGLIFVAVGTFWFLRREKLPALRVADAAAVAGALGLGIGRIGCTLAGCDYGKPVDPSFPLAIKFPSATQPGHFFGLTVPPNTMHLAPDDHWVYPTQVFQSLCGFLTAIFLYWLWKRRRFPGQILAAFLFIKPAYRFVIEYFRGDADRGFVTLGPLGALSQAQVIGLVLMTIAVVLWIVLDRRAKRAAQDSVGTPVTEP